MKFLKRLLIICLAFFVFLMGLGYLLRWHWGKDLEKIAFKNEVYDFSAARDSTGVWQIEARDELSLFFALGYVQAVDREFQTEAVRQVSQGRGSELFGKGFINRDRLMRLISRAADHEWDELDKNSLTHSSMDAYAQGRNEYLKVVKTSRPVEYRMFGLERSALEPWSAKDVLRINRFHSWDFSYDQYEELRAHVIKKTLGEKWGAFVLPEEADSFPALYEQNPGLGLGSAFAPQFKIPEPKVYLPPPNQVAVNASPSSQDFPSSEQSSWGAGNPRGASNSWIIANPKTGLSPTLCNDTHLGFNWPSSLYPVRYKIPGKVSATGFMLPGTPLLVIGNVKKYQGSNIEREMVWGITMASYVDTQDLVKLSPSTLAKAVKRSEEFLVRDPTQAEAAQRLVFNDEWTEFGPRVDDFLDWADTKPAEPVALDWMGFRDVKSPYEFFLGRMFGASENLEQDLVTKWAFPSVNFSWIEKNKGEGLSIGHIVTGLAFERDRLPTRSLNDEAALRKRKISQPSMRPGLKMKFDGSRDFFLVSGNQKIWNSSLGRRLAHDYVDGTRAQRILDRRENANLNAEYSQSDYYVPTLKNFWTSMRQELSADRMCGKGDQRFVSACLQLVAELDQWDGVALTDRWQTTVAALWHMKMREALWPSDKVNASPALKKWFMHWARTGTSLTALNNVIGNKKKRAEWETFSSQDFLDLAAQRFNDSLNELTNRLGPLTAQWSWGAVHRISWVHPFGFIPEPVGALLKEAFLGMAPAVPGGFDSPGRYDIAWDPQDPVFFPSTHGAVMRFCKTLKVDDLPSTSSNEEPFRWSNVTGPSGNPFSKWSRVMPEKYHFKNELFQVED